MPRPILGLPILAAVAAALVPAAAGAAVPVKTVTMAGFKAPGTPAKYNKVFVTKYGPSKPKHIVVLVPGTSGGAGDFTNVAENVVKNVKGTAVWAIDRRSQVIEDTSKFAEVLANKSHHSPSQLQGDFKSAIDYYLGWFTNPSITKHFQPPKDADYQFALNWGLNVSIEDTHRVVQAARKASGHKVILGGHSLGGSVVTSYAVWDFKGKPGYKDLSGLALIDGGGTSTTPADLDTVKTGLQTLKDSKQPWLDLLGIGLPWASGVLVELGAVAARMAPTLPSQVNELAILPPMFKTGFPVTNRAQLGFALDATTSPAALGLIHIRAGQLATTGDPRDWVDGEVTPIANAARAFGQEPSNGAEWYFPKRLSFDLQGMAGLKPNAASKYLGLHPKYATKAKLPVIAVQSDLSKGRLKTGVQNFVALNHSPLTFINAETTMSHLDPLLAAPKTNVFLKAFIPWLKKHAR